MQPSYHTFKQEPYSKIVVGKCRYMEFYYGAIILSKVNATEGKKIMIESLTYQFQWFIDPYSCIWTRYLRFKWSPWPQFLNSVPLLTAEHPDSSLTFWGILYLSLNAFLGLCIIKLHKHKFIYICVDIFLFFNRHLQEN